MLVGDSVGMVKLGYENTIPVTLDDILHHVKAVGRGLGREKLRRPLLVADMPYLTYELDPTEAARNAGRLIKEGGAEAVKLEGGMEIAPTVKELNRVHVPVMGHLGLTPQAIHRLGGYRSRARGGRAEKMVTDAKVLRRPASSPWCSNACPRTWRASSRASSPSPSSASARARTATARSSSRTT